MRTEKVHFIAGAVVGATVNFAIQSAEMAMNYDREFDGDEFFLCAGAGAFTGLAPDILEPNATHQRMLDSLPLPHAPWSPLGNHW